MHGLMMDIPLMISAIIRYAADVNAEARVISRSVEGPMHRYGYRDAYRRICQLAHALRGFGVQADERVATLAWNGHRHFELYYAISGIGAVCHTINPRLFREQIVYIVNHARDRYLCVDLTFLPLLEALATELKSVRGFIVMTDAEHMPKTALPNALCYEELLSGQPTQFDWPSFDERNASALCYTSGTTGNPKGVLYSHRSTLLHAYSVLATGMSGMSAESVVLPVVPLFHVNAWGLPYTAPMAGASLVFPGPRLDGASLLDLIESEEVTDAWGVPTVWLGLLNEARKRGARFTSLKRVVIGGAAAPRAMIEAFENEFGVEVLHGWGMTEMSPVGSTSVLKPSAKHGPARARHDLKTKQGRPLFGVEMKIVDGAGKALPHDGVASGELRVRGPTITSGYFDDPQAGKDAFDAEGWFRTGDVATIDPDGLMQIVDRLKDVVKSGGEWISSIALENAAMGHPRVAEAAVIGIAHPKWDERPLLVVVPAKDGAPSAEELRAYLAEKVAKWWLPDAIEFVAELPHGATGKLLKSELRERFKNYRWPVVR
ncbi:MAG: long-chain-fatty-acid--CoA ligase [Gammaproteobacteria bacterium]